jgi:ABC-type nitrate/sulfonate/bicarbonate transport system substrate-binding protein
LKTVADLRGKTIGITGIGGMGEFTVVESLRRNGLVKDRDFTVLNIEGGPAARIAALKTGKVQAVPLTPGQRVQIENEGYYRALGYPRVAPRDSFDDRRVDKGIHQLQPG